MARNVQGWVEDGRVENRFEGCIHIYKFENDENRTAVRGQWFLLITIIMQEQETVVNIIFF